MELIDPKEEKQAGTIGTRVFIDTLTKSQYPMLYRTLTRIGAALQDLEETDALAASLITIQLKMRSEMDELCRLEEEMLFPWIFRMEMEDRKAESCKPFKMVKHHYSHLLSSLQQFKKHLALPLSASPVWDIVNHQVLAFERSLIEMQIRKEQVLFKPFRNCNNSCNVL